MTAFSFVFCSILSSSRRAADKTVYTGIAMVARAIGPDMDKLFQSLFDPMFAGGLSEPLVDALFDISESMPALLPEIQGEAFVFQNVYLANWSRPAA